MEVANPDLALILLVSVFAPVVIISLVAMFKHYHLWIHIYRGDKHTHKESESE